MDKSKLALVMQKMKTAEQQRDGYKKQVQWFRGNAPHIEMPMEIANLPDGESTSPSGSFASSFATGGSAQVDPAATAAANRRTEELEAVVDKQKQAIEILKKKRAELEAKLAQGGEGGEDAGGGAREEAQAARLRVPDAERAGIGQRR